MLSLSKLKSAIKKRINYEKRVVVGKAGFVVPVQSGRAVHASDPWMQTVLAELFADFPGTFVDVGVNLGQTLICAKALDPDRPYVGFEPNLTCVSYAQEFVRVNAIRNVVLVPAALADQSGIVELNFISPSAADSCASIVPDFRPGRTIATQKVLMIGGGSGAKHPGRPGRGDQDRRRRGRGAGPSGAGGCHRTRPARDRDRDPARLHA